MNQFLQNYKPFNVFTGVPQIEELQVYKVPTGSGVVLTQVILNNPEESDAKVTLTINTQGVAVFKMEPSETKIVNLYLVLKSDEYVALKQDGKVSVSLNGSIA